METRSRLARLMWISRKVKDFFKKCTKEGIKAEIADSEYGSME